jgi:3',5'-cyclic AMP phosphodiesterase CpdA
VLRFAGAVVAAGVSRGVAAERESRWALLSDTHIPANREEAYRGFRPVENLQKVVAQVSKAKPEGCIIGGDLARLVGLPGDYAELKVLLTPIAKRVPIGFCMGNHDNRENFAASFSSTSGLQPLKQKHVVVIDQSPIRMILLDSLIETNRTPGLLGKAQRTWLDTYLEGANNTPTVIFVHHTLDDGDNSLLDSDRLLRIAAKYRQVKAVFYGHSHRYSYDTYEGVHLVNIPAVGYNFNPDQPVGWLDAKFASSGVELTLRAVGGDATLHGKTRPLSWRS